MIFARKWGLEPYFAYQSPTLWTVNRRKTQKISRLQIPHPNREQNCSRMCLFANCTRLNLTMFTILPDRGNTKIAETVLVSAICGFLPICSVIRLGKPRGIYILIIKRLYRLTFAHPTFEPCMACIVVPCFAFKVMSEDVCLHIRFSNLVEYKITQKLSNIKLLKD